MLAGFLEGVFFNIDINRSDWLLLFRRLAFVLLGHNASIIILSLYKHNSKTFKNSVYIGTIMARRHTRLQKQAAGKRGKTEAPVKVGRRRGRLDANTRKKAVEIERSGDPQRIKWALQKLSKSGQPNKILKVNHRYIPLAQEIKRKLRVRGIKIKNLTSRI
jgi:hypothetical protein